MTCGPIHLPGVEKPGNLIYLTHFTAGLRVFDIKDPHLPVETGWFIPPEPTRRRGPQPRTKLVQLTEDVQVEARGNICSTAPWGLWIVRYTGPDQPGATAR